MTGNEFWDKRMELGYTQVEIAELLGVLQPTIWRWEKTEGEIRNSRMLELALKQLGKDKVERRYDEIEASHRKVKAAVGELKTLATELSAILGNGGKK